MEERRAQHAADDGAGRRRVRPPGLRAGRPQLGRPRFLLILSVAAAAALLAHRAAADRQGNDDEDFFRPDDGVELASRLKEGPLVVVADVIDVETKAHLLVREVLRGRDVPERLTVAFRSPNLGRTPGTPGFKVEKGEQAVFVLAPWTDFHGDVVKANLWVAAGGYAGKIPVPPEGGPALLDAARAIIRYQDSGDPSGGAAAVTAWLSGPNPWLVDFALDQAARLALADRAMAPVLLERIDDPSPRRRSRSVAALGLGLERGRFDRRRSNRAQPLDQDDEVGRSVREAIVRVARTDPDPAVRREAVKQFGAGTIPGASAILAAIAKDDPDQGVRYEAAASLADLGALRVR